MGRAWLASLVFWRPTFLATDATGFAATSSCRSGTSELGEAAVGDETGARRVATVIGTEEQDSLGYFLRPPDPSEGRHFLERLFAGIGLFLGLEIAVYYRCVDRARRHRVHPNRPIL